MLWDWVNKSDVKCKCLCVSLTTIIRKMEIGLKDTSSQKSWILLQFQVNSEFWYLMCTSTCNLRSGTPILVSNKETVDRIQVILRGFYVIRA